VEVPAERVSIRKTHEIARSANLSQSTVHEYLHRFTAAGLSWPLPEQMSEPEVEAALFPTDPKPARAPARDLPDFADIPKNLQEHKRVTLQLLSAEYRVTHPDGYRYSQFCHHYQQWKYQRDVMRREHRPAEKVFVDNGKSIANVPPFKSTRWPGADTVISVRLTCPPRFLLSTPRRPPRSLARNLKSRTLA
jgi:hypothetical protein